MNDIVNGPVEESSKEDDVISACVVFDITVNDNNYNIIRQKGKDGKYVDSLKYYNPFIVLPGETSYDMDSIMISSRAEETKIGEKRGINPLTKLDYDQVTVIPIAKDEIADASEIMDILRVINSDDLTSLFTSLQLEGLNYKEAKDVVFDGMLYLHLDVTLKYIPSLTRTGLVLGSIDVWFMDSSNRRISSIRTIYPKPKKGLFQRMKIGLDAGYKGTDETVYKNFYCRYCSKKINTGTIEELARTGQLRDACEDCEKKEYENNVVNKGKDTFVEKTYKISGDASFINNLEVLFREINIMCSVGASREINIYVDGDGAVNLNIKKEDGSELAKNCTKYGVLKRERYYGEGSENGYLTYLDLG